MVIRTFEEEGIEANAQWVRVSVRNDTENGEIMSGMVIQILSAVIANDLSIWKQLTGLIYTTSIIKGRKVLGFDVFRLFAYRPLEWPLQFLVRQWLKKIVFTGSLTSNFVWKKKKERKNYFQAGSRFSFENEISALLLAELFWKD